MAIHNNCVFKNYKTVNKTLSLKSINKIPHNWLRTLIKKYHSLVKADQQPLTKCWNGILNSTFKWILLHKKNEWYHSKQAVLEFSLHSRCHNIQHLKFIAKILN